MLMSLFTDTVLCLSLACLIVEHKLMLELDLYVKQTNMNKLFLNRTQIVYKQLGSFTILLIIKQN